MESPAHVAGGTDDGFEIVETPMLTSTISASKRTPTAETLPPTETSEIKTLASTTAAEHMSGLSPDPASHLSHDNSRVKEERNRDIATLVSVMQANADALSKNSPVFHANLASSEPHHIFRAYSSGIDEEHRQSVNCSACKYFLRTFGDLCVIEDDGSLRSLFWPRDAVGVPEFFKTAIMNVLKLFEGQAVGNQFQIRKIDQQRVGKPLCGGWSHISVTLGHVPLRRKGAMDSQDTATSFEMLDRIISDYSLQVVQRAHHMLHEDELPYASSHKAPIAYLRDTILAMEDRKLSNPIVRNNLLTKHARQAFPGCLSSLRGGVIGCLLVSIKDGDDFKMIKDKWERKTNPLTYLRPTAAPSEGNIADAEKVFAQLGFTPNDLARVYATHDQVPSSAILWSSPVTKPSSEADVSTTTDSPLFGHLRPRIAPSNPVDGASNADGPVNRISFRSFGLRVLPTAKSVDFMIHEPMIGSFFTIGRSGSKPLMAHHSPTNTASWYYWLNAQSPSVANLSAGWNPVVSILSFPHMWEEFAQASDALDDDTARINKTFKHVRLDIRFLFALRGARDTTRVGLALFPTLMRGEFHGVRKTVEAFSNKGTLDVPPQQDERGWVGGVAVDRETLSGTTSSSRDITVRVRNGDGIESKYAITLWA